MRGRLDEPDEYCPVVRGGDEEVERIREMISYSLSNPEDVPKAGNACTTVIKAVGARPSGRGPRGEHGYDARRRACGDGTG